MVDKPLVAIIIMLYGLCAMCVWGLMDSLLNSGITDGNYPWILGFPIAFVIGGIRGYFITREKEK